MKKLFLLSFLVLFLKALSSQGQTVDTLTIQSKVFGQTKKVKVALPYGYDKYDHILDNKDRKYMVVYLFDSQSDNFFNFYRATINYLVNQYTIQPVILVGISSPERQYEFTPKAQTEEGVKNFQKSGGADILAKHLRDEVMPAITAKYNCLPYNVGIGHSLGATFVSYALLKYPELFNAVIAISPNFQYDKEQMVNKFDSLANTKTLNHKFLYLAHGYKDATEEKFRPSTMKVNTLLTNKNIAGLKWQYKSMDNDSHGLTAMEGIFKGLVALNRELKITDETLNILLADKSKPFMQNVNQYYQSLSQWSGLKFPTLYDVNNVGYALLSFKKNQESVDFFKWGISLYPDNSNLYDSLGEVEIAVGDKAAALKYYSEGLEVAKKEKLDATVYKGKIAGFEKNINALKN